MAQQLIVHATINYSGSSIRCTADGHNWEFCNACMLVPLMYFVHVFVTMQTVATTRAVFIKTTKKTTVASDVKSMRKDFKRMFSRKITKALREAESSSDSDMGQNIAKCMERHNTENGNEADKEMHPVSINDVQDSPQKNAVRFSDNLTLLLTLYLV